MNRDLTSKYLAWLGVKKVSVKVAVLLLAILFSCISNPLGQDRMEAEEYEVYRELTRLAQASVIKEIAVAEFTYDHDRDFSDLPRDRKRRLQQLQSSTLRNFRLRNRQQIGLSKEFGDDIVVHLISQDEFINSLGKSSAGEQIARMFSAEYRIAFSRVGFNTKRDQALVHVNFRSNSDRKYAFGNYFLLSKQNGSWTLRQWAKSWEY